LSWLESGQRIPLVGSLFRVLAEVPRLRQEQAQVVRQLEELQRLERERAAQLQAEAGAREASLFRFLHQKLASLETELGVALHTQSQLRDRLDALDSRAAGLVRTADLNALQSKTDAGFAAVGRVLDEVRSAVDRRIALASEETASGRSLLGSLEDRLNQALSALSSTREQLENLESRVASVSAQGCATQDVVSTLDQRVSQLSEQSGLTQRELHQVVSSIDSLRLQDEASAGAIEELRKRALALSEQAVASHETVSQVERRVRDLSVQSSQVQEALRSIEPQLQRLAAAAESGRSKLEALQSELDNLSARNAEGMVELDRARALIRGVEEKAFNTLSDLAAQCNQLFVITGAIRSEAAARFERVDQSVAELNTTLLSEVERAAGESRSRAESVEAAVSSLAAQVEQAAAALEQAAAAIEQVRAAQAEYSERAPLQLVDSLSGDLKHALAELSQLRSELGGIDSRSIRDFQQVQQRLENLSAYCAELKSRGDAAVHLCDELRASLNGAVEELTAADSNVASRMADLAARTEAVERALANTLPAGIESVNQSIAGLESRFGQLEGRAGETASVLQQHSEALSRLAGLQSGLRAVQRTNIALRSEVDRLAAAVREQASGSAQAQAFPVWGPPAPQAASKPASDQLAARLDAIQAEIEASMATFSDTVSQLARENRQSTAQREKLAERLAEAEKAIQALTSLAATVQQNNEHLRSMIVHLHRVSETNVEETLAAITNLRKQVSQQLAALHAARNGAPAPEADSVASVAREEIAVE